MIKVLFFAQFRERLGCSEMKYDIDKSVSVSWLRNQLAMQGSTWQECLSEGNVLMAVNQTLATEHTMINNGDEVAFFPPVTGG